MTEHFISTVLQSHSEFETPMEHTYISFCAMRDILEDLEKEIPSAYQIISKKIKALTEQFDKIDPQCK